VLFVTGQNTPAKDHLKTAIFAGGCFWCMEADFEKLPGIIEVVSGYTGGNSSNPNYKNYGKSGHIEAVRIEYDSSVISYRQLLDIFWVNIDPTDKDGQFCDRGQEYSSAVFYLTKEQKKLALESKNLIENLKYSVNLSKHQFARLEIFITRKITTKITTRKTSYDTIITALGADVMND